LQKTTQHKPAFQDRQQASTGGIDMLGRRLASFAVLAAALAVLSVPARAFDDAQYPDWKGQWRRYLTPDWADKARSIKPSSGAADSKPR
jgi:hypothetical protein